MPGSPGEMKRVLLQFGCPGLEVSPLLEKKVYFGVLGFPGRLKMLIGHLWLTVDGASVRGPITLTARRCLRILFFMGWWQSSCSIEGKLENVLTYVLKEC